MNLPTDLLNRIQCQLESEYPDFLAACQEPRVAGLCTNLLKVTPAQLKQLLPYIAEVIPWCSHGFYFDEAKVRPAKDPYYHAGLFYIQEPSAMLPAELLDIQPGDRVLDLCAAPGGKSVQIAGKLQGILAEEKLAEFSKNGSEKSGRLFFRESCETFGGKFWAIFTTAPKMRGNFLGGTRAKK